MDFRREAETARDLAFEAGRIALDLQGKVGIRDKGGGEGLVTDADLALEEMLLERLGRAFPGDAILSEETRTDVDTSAPRIWCVDPIDGTREYAKGRGEFAVQVGLVASGEAVAGALAVPASDQVFWGWKGGGARLATKDGEEDVRLGALHDLARATAIHTRSHQSRRLKEALDLLGVGDRIAAGGVGFKAAQLLLGRAHLYLHTGRGLKWWDSAAPAAVVLAAGGSVTDPEGAPIRYRSSTRHRHGMLFAVPGLGSLVAERLQEGSGP